MSKNVEEPQLPNSGEPEPPATTPVSNLDETTMIQSNDAKPETEPAATTSNLDEHGKKEPEPEPESVSNDDAIQSNNTEKSELVQLNDTDSKDSPSPKPPSSVEDRGRPAELKKDEEGSRTFTMRELLNEMKDGGGGGGSEHQRESTNGSESEKGNLSSPYRSVCTFDFFSRESLEQQQQNNVALELINSITGVDEEGRSRQRILSFAARKYASAIERNPEDYDAHYNWALVLQESADNVDPDSSSPSRDALLEEACKKYDEATCLCPTLHDAFYNWAIAISDQAKMRGRTKEAEELWKQATKKYEKAVQLNWNSPQALNNWGLALQELSAIVPAREKQGIVRTAISKFRAAIQLQFDFHRAIYNLGTVLYALAEDTLRIGGSGNSIEISPNELYSQSAIYIAAAHALKPNYSVYRSALRLVRSMLPLPYLKVGELVAPPAGNMVAPHCDWRRSQFVLNHEALVQLSKVEKSLSQQTLSGRTGDRIAIDKSIISVDISDIVSVSACSDLTLPPGAGLCIDTVHGPVYLVADSCESLDAWLDAIRLVYTIFARGKSDVLAGIITG
ncbi:hypothetical protein RJ641_035757 [Dillenia turbinata]|uniref:PH domain-containing protein n=1 Tax=Dillenia turbinata TaxID=194707 RepID=A0AAN8VTT5_9MAGN